MCGGALIRTTSSPKTKKLLRSQIGASDTPADIDEHLVAETAHEGDVILAEDIAGTLANIDLVQMHGYGFLRHRGGPMICARPAFGSRGAVEDG